MQDAGIKWAYDRPGGTGEMRNPDNEKRQNQLFIRLKIGIKKENAGKWKMPG